jgi:hypothetical protein
MVKREHSEAPIPHSANSESQATRKKGRWAFKMLKELKWELGEN